MMTVRLADTYCQIDRTRQGYGKDRSSSRSALDRDFTPVGLGNPLGDGQAQAGTGPGSVTGASRVGPPEAIEDVGKVPGRYSDSGVPHDQIDAGPVIRQGETNLPARRGVFDRVGHQVEQQLADSILVDPQPDGRRGDLGLDRDAGPLGQHSGRFGSFVDQVSEIALLRCQWSPAFVRP